MTITTEVMQRVPSTASWVWNVPDSLHTTDEQISHGLAKRLAAYALRDLTECGFNVEGWQTNVETCDADLPPAERYYVVRFTNPAGGQLGVQGIATRKGWPVLDHGMFAERA